MAKLGIEDAFRQYGARLKNSQWAVSSISERDELVISCWRQKLKLVKGEGVLRYTDELARWREGSAGRKLLASHLQDALDESRDVRLVVVDTEETDAVDDTTNLSKIEKNYGTRKDLIGKVVKYDGNVYIIDFRRTSA